MAVCNKNWLIAFVKVRKNFGSKSTTAANVHLTESLLNNWPKDKHITIDMIYYLDSLFVSVFFKTSFSFQTYFCRKRKNRILWQRAKIRLEWISQSNGSIGRPLKFVFGGWIPQSAVRRPQSAVRSPQPMSCTGQKPKRAPHVLYWPETYDSGPCKSTQTLLVLSVYETTCFCYLRQLSCLRTGLESPWLWGNNYWAFSLPKQWNGEPVAVPK